MLDDDDLDLESVWEEEVSEGDKFEAWRRRAEAIVELREAQEDMRNEKSRRWEDWLVDGTHDDVDTSSSWDQDQRYSALRESRESDPSDLLPDRGLVDTVRDLVLGRDDDDILYEDRVFRYASFNSVSTYIYTDCVASCKCTMKISYLCFQFYKLLFFSLSFSCMLTVMFLHAVDSSSIIVI